MRLKSIPALLGAVIAGHAWAQAIPDAGQTVRELDRVSPATQQPAREAPSISVSPERPAMAAPEGAKVAVKSFRITGAQRFSEAELSGLVAEWAGRELSLADLQAAAARITRHYREQGFLVARAYVPAQAMRDGVVEIAVLEGRLGKVDLKNTSRVSDAQVQSLLGQTQPGDAIQGPALERNLILLNELPGVAGANAALQPGASVGLSDLVIALEPGPAVSGAIDVDNHGNRYTGAYRLGGTMHLNSPLRLGDQFTARMVASDEQLYYGRVAYRVPVGSSGLALGAAYSASRYHLGRAFEPLDVNGDARIATAFVTYPFVRSSGFNLVGAFSLDHKTLQDRIGAVASVSDKSVRSATAGLVGNGRAGSGTYGFSAGYTNGKLDIETASARAADAATARSHGSYGKLSYAVNGLVPLSGAWSVYAGLSGQLARKNLDSSEKFSLGGADGVRAYPQGEAPADEGYLLTTELRYALPATSFGAMQLAGYIDHGGVRINKNPFAAGDNTRRLSAAGIGFNMSAPGNFMVRASVAWKLGSEDATSDTDRSPRAWLQAVKYF